MAHISDQQLKDAEDRMTASLHSAHHAVKAHYDRETSKLVILLSSGVELLVPSHLAEGISDAHPDDLGEIEISPTGFGLHFPRIDADLYVPGLLAGVLGSQSFMSAQAAQVGASRSPAKGETAAVAGNLEGPPSVMSVHTSYVTITRVEAEALEKEFNDGMAAWRERLESATIHPALNLDSTELGRVHMMVKKYLRYEHPLTFALGNDRFSPLASRVKQAVNERWIYHEGPTQREIWERYLVEDDEQSQRVNRDIKLSE